MKKMDTEFMALVERAMKQNAEILERLAQYDSGDATEEVAPVAEEAKSDEVATEVAAETAEIVEEKAAEEIPAVETTETVEEVKSEEAAAEQTETTEATTEVVEEKAADDQKQTAAISFDDLKEFHLLLKEMSK